MANLKEKRELCDNDCPSHDLLMFEGLRLSSSCSPSRHVTIPKTFLLFNISSSESNLGSDMHINTSIFQWYLYPAILICPLVLDVLAW